MFAYKNTKNEKPRKVKVEKTLSKKHLNFSSFAIFGVFVRELCCNCEI